MSGCWMLAGLKGLEGLEVGEMGGWDPRASHTLDAPGCRRIDPSLLLRVIAPCASSRMMSSTTIFSSSFQTETSLPRCPRKCTINWGYTELVTNLGSTISL